MYRLVISLSVNITYIIQEMKIAIHHKSGSFSERWIEYCKEKDIPYMLVNCYDTDIILFIPAKLTP
jgi:hypothetical protein